MENYIKNLFRKPGLDYNPEAVEYMLKAVECFTTTFTQEVLDLSGYYLDQHPCQIVDDNAVRNILEHHEQYNCIIKEKTRQKLRQEGVIQ